MQVLSWYVHGRAYVLDQCILKGRLDEPSRRRDSKNAARIPNNVNRLVPVRLFPNRAILKEKSTQPWSLDL